MRKKQNIELHNEEVREIMSEIPGRLLRWGLAIIFLIFFSIIVGSYFFTFREMVSVPLVITTTNPPAPIISKVSGRIERWMVSDGQKVRKGDDLYLVQNGIIIQDFYTLENIIYHLDTSVINEELVYFKLPEKLILGELQDLYNQFYKNWENYRYYIENSMFQQKLDLLEEQMTKQNQNYELSLQQKEMIESEYEIDKKSFERYQTLFEKGGISENQLEEAKARIIQSERAYLNFLASLKSAEINLINQKRTLLDMQEQHQQKVEQFELSIYENIRILKRSLSNWREMYLPSSPIDGTVTLTKYWSENHVISAGERIATIVPSENSEIICRAAVPSSGVAKVSINQKVNVKLTGYPYMEHGILSGKINSVSLVPEEEGYIVEIGLDEGMLSTYSEHLKLVQEMDGTADIITGEMRMIYRFINPLRSALSIAK